MLPKPDVIQLLSHATVFVCPSIYEPLGIVNLEAMACEAAVVRQRRRRHRRGRRRRRHGLLVPFEASRRDAGAARTPTASRADFAAAVNALVRDPERAAAMGRAGRERAVDRFSWPAIARRRSQVYERL